MRFHRFEMTLRVAINGFGRIGRNFMRCWLGRGANTNIEVVGINVFCPKLVPIAQVRLFTVLSATPKFHILTIHFKLMAKRKCYSDRNPLNLLGKSGELIW